MVRSFVLCISSFFLIDSFFFLKIKTSQSFTLSSFFSKWNFSLVPFFLEIEKGRVLFNF